VSCDLEILYFILSMDSNDYSCSFVLLVFSTFWMERYRQSHTMWYDHRKYCCGRCVV
jgi:hypothetical protein